MERKKDSTVIEIESSHSDVSGSSKNKKSKKKKKYSEERKRKLSSSSDSSSSTSDSDSSSKKIKKKLKKLKKKRKKEKKKDKKQKKKDKNKAVTEDEDGAAADIPLDLMEKPRSLAPMTKEEWEKRQSVVKRVYDETTGRNRLIKGDGEVIEEIVSRDRHMEINRQATRGDGMYFQKQISKDLK
ncbi:ADP-ribosylation factor-like protein 6-interacting protein 4 [Aethina tumida]|uniref:ADP-ribosylation factor-like protein 6-interacting protein 4 n=1 Tax=Aethina tumida TaxID=116153 RepID=UPI00096B0B2D|nr:ADP-ribosylation factor-like protein 6-interacting protein 4 [Aethina tumida]